MPKPNGTQLYRICQLEKSVEGLDVKIDKIQTNELPHLKESIIKMQGSIEQLKVRINILSMVNVGAIILALLASKFL